MSKPRSHPIARFCCAVGLAFVTACVFRWAALKYKSATLAELAALKHTTVAYELSSATAVVFVAAAVVFFLILCLLSRHRRRSSRSSSQGQGGGGYGSGYVQARSAPVRRGGSSW